MEEQYTMTITVQKDEATDTLVDCMADLEELCEDVEAGEVWNVRPRVQGIKQRLIELVRIADHG